MKGKNPTTLWKIIAAVLCVALIAVTCCWLLGVGKSSGGSDGSKTVTASKRYVSDPAAKIGGEDVLSLWNDSAKLKTELKDYVQAVTKEGGKDFIPVEDRIAVFDFDGTLFCETDPNYFDYTLLVYRVTEDPDYKDKASDFEKEVAEKIIDLNENGTKYDGLEVDHGKAVASAFKGMTIDEFYAYVGKFMQQDMPSYTGMKRGEGFYKPMLQVIDYLEANDFTVYIVSGTDRFIVRGLVQNSEFLNTPPEQIMTPTASSTSSRMTRLSRAASSS